MQNAAPQLGAALACEARAKPGGRPGIFESIVSISIAIKATRATTTQIRQFHPLANLFPLIEGDEFAALVEDVRANGLLVPIVLHEGMILEGRNR